MSNKDQRLDTILKKVDPDFPLIRRNVATPFVKWAGGKRSILKELLKFIPPSFENYYEPFVGGGALFFALFNKKLLKKAFLSDINCELMITYKVIKEKPELLIEQLEIHEQNHNKDYYYEIREQHDLEDPIGVAARFIYLNKTCYNGLYRVNKKNQFNVPIGRYENPNILHEDNIYACHKALQKADIKIIDFQKIKTNKNDFVYFDPPYHPIDENSFTSYTKYDFTKEDQIKLRDFAFKLREKGIYVILSNSNTKFINEIYSDKLFRKIIVKAPRLVGCKSNERGAIEELLIVSY